MLTLTDKDLDAITSVIFENSKIDLRHYAKSSLSRRFARIADLYSLTSLEALLDFASNSSLSEKLIQEITVNTTEMFRDPSFWQHLRTTVLPELNTHDSIKIWHAGCSSGEEVLSMQILLEELGMRHKTTAFACDINSIMVGIAQSGSYATKNFALSEKNYISSGGKHSLRDYISSSDDWRNQYRPDLLENVSFKRFDLVQECTFSKYDLVLCRNVMIYFDFDLQEKVLSKFIDGMHSKAFLAIGQNETIINHTLLEKLQVYNETEKIYRLRN